VIYQVTWQSARTVRAAKLRESNTLRPRQCERGEEMLEEQPDHYIITIQLTGYDPLQGRG